MRTKQLSTALLLFFTLIAFSQTTPGAGAAIKEVTVSGIVVDKETNQPLEYATIAFYDVRKERIETGGITDLEGKFSIPVKTGTYNISIEYISYKTITLANRTIEVDLDLGTFYLELDIATLDAVEIIAEKTTVEIKLDKKIYNVGKDLTVSGGTAAFPSRSLESGADLLGRALESLVQAQRRGGNCVIAFGSSDIIWAHAAPDPWSF